MENSEKISKATSRHIVDLANAGYSVYEISDILKLPTPDVRPAYDTTGWSIVNLPKKDYRVLRRVLQEIKDEAELLKQRAKAVKAVAANIEAEALDLLEQRLAALREKADNLTSRESSELCAILKALQPYFNDNGEVAATAARSLVEVKFV